MKLLKYSEQQDFSLISTTDNLDDEAIELLSSSLRKDIFRILKNMTPQVYENRKEFTEAILNDLGQELWQIHGELICQCCDLGRRKFYAKFGWLFNYQQDIHTYAEMLTLIRSVQTQLKTQGLHRQSPTQWIETITTHSFSPRVKKIQQQIIEYLTFEANQIPAEQILLGTSDVIESLFGKYKLFATRRPLKEISTSILLIPLFTLKITTDLVKQAMESIRFIDVCSWAKSVFGSSMLSQRRRLQLALTSDIEPA